MGETGFGLLRERGVGESSIVPSQERYEPKIPYLRLIKGRYLSRKTGVGIISSQDVVLMWGADSVVTTKLCTLYI